MKLHKTELVSGLLDGQLVGVRRWLAHRHIRACPVCGAEYRRQRGARELLASNPPSARMSESAELFWSKVKREIEARGDETVEMSLPRLTVLDWLGQHQYAAASATVAVALAAVWVVQSQTATRRQGVAAPAAHPVATVEHVSTAIPDSVATPLDADDKDTAVIWVSGLPWTANMTEMQTLFANLDT